jgi:hypothetical protein
MAERCISASLAISATSSCENDDMIRHRW